MDEKEQEVHHKLRQHFSDRKFSSSVTLAYAQGREPLESIKPRYSLGVDGDLTERHRAAHFHKPRPFS